MGRKQYAGPDPAFPWLDENARFDFPLPEKSPHPSIAAWGGNLSPGMLLSAYEQGIFPWFNDEEPILWHSPDPRFIIYPEKLHISESMRKLFKRGEYTITFDRDFPSVINNCAEAARPGQNGTWITRDVIHAYIELHRLGWVHSAEAWADGELAGGCYGLRLGNVFFGESMFARRSNASKAAFLTLAKALFDDGVRFIDCQVHTDHLESLGGEEISRAGFLRLLRETLAVRESRTSASDKADRRGNWGEIYEKRIPSLFSTPPRA
jgi:leucyl/phenylalanyl-tRNA--protein transferase